MHLVLKTRVRQPLPAVWAGFDRSLFDQLSPPFPPVDVVRFDGCRAGDVVHLRLNFLLFRQDWISLITDQQTITTARGRGFPDTAPEEPPGPSDRADEIYFVDQGTRLPFFLTHWHHHHRLLRDPAGGTVIVDDVTFRTPLRLTDYLMYPLLWLQFAYRQPIYRRVFGKT